MKSVTDVYAYIMSKLKLDAYTDNERKYTRRHVSVLYASAGPTSKEFVQKEFAKLTAVSLTYRVC